MGRLGGLWSFLTSHFLVSLSALSRHGAQERQSEGPGVGRQLCGRKWATLHSDARPHPGQVDGEQLTGPHNQASEPRLGDVTHLSHIPMEMVGLSGSVFFLHAGRYPSLIEGIRVLPQLSDLTPTGLPSPWGKHCTRRGCAGDLWRVKEAERAERVTAALGCELQEPAVWNRCFCMNTDKLY